MTITVAGNKKEYEDGLKLTELIEKEDIESPEYVTVTINDEFISKGQEFLPLITSEEQLFRVTDAAIQFFDDYANPGERFKFTIDRVGAEKLQEVLKGAYNG